MVVVLLIDQVLNLTFSAKYLNFMYLCYNYAWECPLVV